MLFKYRGVAYKSQPEAFGKDVMLPASHLTYRGVSYVPNREPAIAPIRLLTYRGRPYRTTGPKTMEVETAVPSLLSAWFIQALHIFRPAHH